MHRRPSYKILLFTAGVCTSILGAGIGADTLDQVMQVGQARLVAAQASQQKIDQLATDTREQFDDYRQVLKQNEGLTVYTDRLDRQIEDQSRRLQDIEASIEQVTVVQRQMPSVIERMIDALEAFIALDLPFYLEEREQRVAFLRANLSRSDLTIAEKFRQVMEAYKIENEYGRKISTFNSTVALQPGVEREATLLQIGRVALMYQTTDARVSGAWDASAGSWIELDSRQYKNAIRQAIRIAQNQAAKDILTVPVTAAERIH